MSVLRSNTLKDASTEPLQTEAASPSKTPKASKPRISIPQLRLGLFSRAFLIITAFMILSLSVWGMVTVNALEEHRADQLAERAASALNIAQKSIQYAAKENRSALTIQLATPGDTQVFPREPGDPYIPFGESRLRVYSKAAYRN